MSKPAILDVEIRQEHNFSIELSAAGQTAEESYGRLPAVPHGGQKKDLTQPCEVGKEIYLRHERRSQSIQDRDDPTSLSDFGSSAGLTLKMRPRTTESRRTIWRSPWVLASYGATSRHDPSCHLAFRLSTVHERPTPTQVRGQPLTGILIRSRN